MRKERTHVPAPLGSTVWEQKKNTSAQKHIYHKHMTCNRGTYPALASSRPVQQPFITAPVADLLDRWRYKAFGGSWSGRGVMSVMGEGSKRVYTAALFQGSLSSMTLAKPAGTGEPEKIRLNFVVSFWRTAANLHSFILSVHSGLWNHQFSLAKP